MKIKRCPRQVFGESEALPTPLIRKKPRMSGLPAVCPRCFKGAAKLAIPLTAGPPSIALPIRFIR